MKIYGISGLGADKRVFTFLNLKDELIPLDWIPPLPHETISKYAKRFAEKYKLNEETEFAIMGVSFGGLIATEISKLYPPKITILISSVETKNELPKILRIIGQSKILKIIPKRLFNPPRKIAYFLFGTDQKDLLNSILNDTDLEFAKWAINELVGWKNTTKLSNVIKISGNKDKLLPPKDSKTIIVAGGEHLMIIDKADEISNIINPKLQIK